MAIDPKRWALPLFLILLVYSVFPTRTHYWDGIIFSLNIEGVHRGDIPSTKLFHPNHLLYTAAGFVLYRALAVIHIPLRPLAIFQIINIGLSIATAYLIWRIASKLTGSRGIALFTMLLFAFGATWWKFSTDANAYIPCVFLMTAILGCVVVRPPRLLPTAMYHVAAMLLHQLAIFMYAPVLVAILSDKGSPARARFRVLTLYIGLTALPVTAAYLVVFLTGHAERTDFFAWITSFSAEAHISRSLRQLVVIYPLSYLKLLVGGRLGLIRDFFSFPVAVSLLSSFGLILYAIILSRRSKSAADTLTSNHRPSIVLWAWLLPYVFFFAWWEPGEAFYRLFVWPPIVLLIAGYVAQSAWLRSRAAALTCAVLAIAAWNFAAFIYPHSKTESDPVLALAETVHRELPKGTTIFYRVLNSDDWYLDYFAPGNDWLPLPSGNLNELQVSKRTCLETTALEAIERQNAREQIQRRLDSNLRWELVNQHHNVRLECLKLP